MAFSNSCLIVVNNILREYIDDFPKYLSQGFEKLSEILPSIIPTIKNCGNIRWDDQENKIEFNDDETNTGLQILIQPAYSELRESIKNLIEIDSKEKFIVYVGSHGAGYSSDWLLEDGVFSANSMLKVLTDSSWIENSSPDMLPINILTPSNSAHWNKILSTLKVKETKQDRVRVFSFSPEMPNTADSTEPSKEEIDSFCKVIHEKYQPVLLNDDILKSTQNIGTLQLTNKNGSFYIFDEGCGQSNLMALNGFNLLIDAGYKRKPEFWNFLQRLEKIDTHILTSWNETNLFGIQSLLDFKSKINLSKDDISNPNLSYCILPIGPNPTIPKKQIDIKSPLEINMEIEAQKTVEQIKNLEIPLLQMCRDSKSITNPHQLYFKLGQGCLDAFPLWPCSTETSGDSKRYVDEWQKDSKSQSIYFDELVKENSCSFLLIWNGSKLTIDSPNDDMNMTTRILISSSCHEVNILKSLEEFSKINISCNTFSGKLEEKKIEKKLNSNDPIKSKDTKEKSNLKETPKSIDHAKSNVTKKPILPTEKTKDINKSDIKTVEKKALDRPVKVKSADVGKSLPKKDESISITDNKSKQLSSDHTKSKLSSAKSTESKDPVKVKDKSEADKKTVKKSAPIDKTSVTDVKKIATKPLENEISTKKALHSDKTSEVAEVKKTRKTLSNEKTPEATEVKKPLKKSMTDASDNKKVTKAPLSNKPEDSNVKKEVKKLPTKSSEVAENKKPIQKLSNEKPSETPEVKKTTKKSLVNDKSTDSDIKKPIKKTAKDEIIDNKKTTKIATDKSIDKSAPVKKSVPGKSDIENKKSTASKPLSQQKPLKSAKGDNLVTKKDVKNKIADTTINKKDLVSDVEKIDVVCPPSISLNTDDTLNNIDTSELLGKMEEIGPVSHVEDDQLLITGERFDLQSTPLSDLITDSPEIPKTEEDVEALKTDALSIDQDLLIANEELPEDEKVVSVHEDFTEKDDEIKNAFNDVNIQHSSEENKLITSENLKEYGIYEDGEFDEEQHHMEPNETEKQDDKDTHETKDDDVAIVNYSEEAIQDNTANLVEVKHDEKSELDNELKDFEIETRDDLDIDNYSNEVIKEVKTELEAENPEYIAEQNDFEQHFQDNDLGIDQTEIELVECTPHKKQVEDELDLIEKEHHEEKTTDNFGDEINESSLDVDNYPEEVIEKERIELNENYETNETHNISNIEKETEEVMEIDANIIEAKHEEIELKDEHDDLEQKTNENIVDVNICQGEKIEVHSQLHEIEYVEKELNENEKVTRKDIENYPEENEYDQSEEFSQHKEEKLNAEQDHVEEINDVSSDIEHDFEETMKEEEMELIDEDHREKDFKVEKDHVEETLETDNSADLMKDEVELLDKKYLEITENQSELVELEDSEDDGKKKFETNKEKSFEAEQDHTETMEDDVLKVEKYPEETTRDVEIVDDDDEHRVKDFESEQDQVDETKDEALETDNLSDEEIKDEVKLIENEHLKEQNVESENEHLKEQDVESEKEHLKEQDFESENEHHKEQDVESENEHLKEQDVESENEHLKEQDVESENEHLKEQNVESENEHLKEQDFESENVHVEELEDDILKVKQFPEEATKEDVELVDDENHREKDFVSEHEQVEGTKDEEKAVNYSEEHFKEQDVESEKDQVEEKDNMSEVTKYPEEIAKEEDVDYFDEDHRERDFESEQDQIEKTKDDVLETDNFCEEIVKEDEIQLVETEQFKEQDFESEHDHIEETEEDIVEVKQFPDEATKEEDVELVDHRENDFESEQGQVEETKSKVLEADKFSENSIKDEVQLAQIEQDVEEVVKEDEVQLIETEQDVEEMDKEDEVHLVETEHFEEQDFESKQDHIEETEDDVVDEKKHPEEMNKEEHMELVDDVDQKEKDFESEQDQVRETKDDVLETDNLPEELITKDEVQLVENENLEVHDFKAEHDHVEETNDEELEIENSTVEMLIKDEEQLVEIEHFQDQDFETKHDHVEEIDNDLLEFEKYPVETRKKQDAELVDEEHNREKEFESENDLVKETKCEVLEDDNLSEDVVNEEAQLVENENLIEQDFEAEHDHVEETNDEELEVDNTNEEILQKDEIQLVEIEHLKEQDLETKEHHVGKTEDDILEFEKDFNEANKDVESIDLVDHSEMDFESQQEYTEEIKSGTLEDYNDSVNIMKKEELELVDSTIHEDIDFECKQEDCNNIDVDAETEIKEELDNVIKQDENEKLSEINESISEKEEKMDQTNSDFLNFNNDVPINENITLIKTELQENQCRSEHDGDMESKDILDNDDVIKHEHELFDIDHPEQLNPEDKESDNVNEFLNAENYIEGVQNEKNILEEKDEKYINQNDSYDENSKQVMNESDDVETEFLEEHENAIKDCDEINTPEDNDIHQMEETKYTDEKEYESGNIKAEIESDTIQELVDEKHVEIEFENINNVIEPTNKIHHDNDFNLDNIPKNLDTSDIDLHQNKTYEFEHDLPISTENQEIETPQDDIGTLPNNEMDLLHKELDDLQMASINSENNQDIERYMPDSESNDSDLSMDIVKDHTTMSVLENEQNTGFQSNPTLDDIIEDASPSQSDSHDIFSDNIVQTNRTDESFNITSLDQNDLLHDSGLSCSKENSTPDILRGLKHINLSEPTEVSVQQIIEDEEIIDYQTTNIYFDKFQPNNSQSADTYEEKTDHFEPKKECSNLHIRESSVESESPELPEQSTEIPHDENEYNIPCKGDHENTTLFTNGNTHDEHFTETDTSTQWNDPLGLPMPTLITGKPATKSSLNPKPSEKTASPVASKLKSSNTPPTKVNGTANNGHRATDSPKNTSSPRTSVAPRPSAPKSAPLSKTTTPKAIKKPEIIDHSKFPAFYMEIAYIPVDLDGNVNPNRVTEAFFTRIRARQYILPGLEHSSEVLNSLLTAKEKWSAQDREVEVRLIPIKMTDTLKKWAGKHAQELSKLNIKIGAAVEHCSVSLGGDDSVSCIAHRIDF